MSDLDSPASVVHEMLEAYANTQMVYVAAKLGIADFLSAGPRSSDELAASTQVNAQALRRVMRGLVNRKILVEVSSGHFALAPAGECLKSDNPDDIKGIAIHVGELLYPTWGSLMHTVKTGEPSFEHLHGMKWFEYLDKNPEHAEIFNRGMANDTAPVVRAVKDVYDFSEIRKVADIGGGEGMMLAELLRSTPGLQGVLFDAPHVVAGAPPRLAEAGVADRCEVLSGNFFESVPSGCDAYIMKSIIHDWNDEESLTILRNLRAAMSPSSRLLLIEPIMPARVEEVSFAVEMDLGMMLLLRGLERTEEQYRALYLAAGFELTKVVDTTEPFSVIEGRPI